MAVKKQEFEHESLQDRQTLAAYLKTVTRGVEEGRFTVSGKDGDITLEPDGLIRFELRVSIKPNRSKLALHLSWRPGGHDPDGPSEKLRIRSGKD